MDYIWMMLGLFLILTAGIIFIVWRYIDSRFPAISIRTKMRGTILKKWYRSIGDVIVQDDPVSLLLGKFIVYGFKSWLDYDLENNKRVYNGYLYKDFIFSLKDKPIEGSQQIIVEAEDKKGQIIMKAKWSKEMLLPVKYLGQNYEIYGSDIVKGKEICGKFVVASQDNDQFTKNSNPILMAIIGILPSLLVLAIVFAGTYFILGMVLDTGLEIVDGLKELKGIA